MRSHRGREAGRGAGMILVVVMITLLFAAAAMAAFLEKASNDLMVEARVSRADRLRQEAYSALDTTLAVLEDFRQADSGLHSASEGWGDPLDWAGYTPGSGRTVDVRFEDESGKIPLIHASSTVLLTLFQNAWGLNADDSQHLTDAILSWMQQNYVPATDIAADYEQNAIPFDPPHRPLRSYDELAAIDFARDLFYDANGRPTDLWWRFRSDFSLFNYSTPDANGAPPDVLTGLGEFTDDQIQAISNFQSGSGKYVGLGPEWFTSSTQFRNAVGAATGNPGKFSTSITALRINITVHEGRAQYRLSVVVAPQGGAKTVQTTATDVKGGASNSANGETSATASTSSSAQPTTSPTSAQTSAASSANIQYPFTFLEIRENDEIPVAPPPPPPPVQS